MEYRYDILDLNSLIKSLNLISFRLGIQYSKKTIQSRNTDRE